MGSPLLIFDVRGVGRQLHMTRNPLLICIGLLTAVLPTTLLFVGVNMLFFVPLVVGLGSVVVGCLRISAAKKRTVTGVGVFLCLAAATCPFALAAYANRSGKPIRIVLPEGYRGRFAIVKDRVKGRSLVFESGAWVFEIPPSGELVVNDDHPFLRLAQNPLHALRRPPRSCDAA